MEEEVAQKAEIRVKQTVELDCAPGGTRPGDLIGGVIEGTGLPTREPVSMFFGNWTWDYSDIDAETFAKAKPIMRDRTIKLYNDHVIRYGSW